MSKQKDFATKPITPREVTLDSKEKVLFTSESGYHFLQRSNKTQKKTMSNTLKLRSSIEATSKKASIEIAPCAEAQPKRNQTKPINKTEILREKDRTPPRE